MGSSSVQSMVKDDIDLINKMFDEEIINSNELNDFEMNSLLRLKSVDLVCKVSYGDREMANKYALTRAGEHTKYIAEYSR